MEVIDKDVLPVFLSVATWAALVVPIFWLLKFRLATVKLAKGPFPVPVKLTVCGLVVALSVKVNEALRVPEPDGVNVTLILQLPFAANELPQVVDSAKSPALVPLNPIPLMDSVAFPEFVMVTLWDALVEPTETPLKVNVEGEEATTGPLPVPLKLTACGLPGALSVMATNAVRVPIAVGEKITLILQLPAAGRELGQVLL